jgi:hypothetical protein
MSFIAATPDELRQAAVDVDGAAAVISGVLGGQGGQFAVPGQPGWDSLARLSTGAPVWTDYLKSFVTSLGGTATDLRTLADTLANADDDAGRPWGGGRVPQ